MCLCMKEGVPIYLGFIIGLPYRITNDFPNNVGINRSIMDECLVWSKFLFFKEIYCHFVQTYPSLSDHDMLMYANIVFQINESEN